MRSIAPWRLMKALVGASLTFLAIGLLAPGSAKAASCDHPSERPGIGLHAIRFDQPSAADQAPKPKPCSGPSCSNKSAPVPTSASSPQPPPRAELWGVLAEALPVEPPGSSARAPEGDLDRPIRTATPVFHPPRLPR